MKSLGKKYTERKSLKEDNAHIKTNEDRINDTLNDTDFMNALGVTTEDVIKQIKISKEQFDEISNYVANYKGTFKELYKELGGWNLGDNNADQDDDNLFDCYYKSLLITVYVDNGKLSVSPHDVYVYANDISAEDMDEMFALDFDKPINYSKLRVNKIEDKELLAEQDLGEDFYEKICRAYVNTANLEWVTTNPENNDSVVHGYFADDDEAEKYDYGAKVTPENFKDVAYAGYTSEEIEAGDVEWYEYDTWEDFYEEYVKDEIAYDINDIGIYGINDEHTAVDKWDFYISEEDLTKLGLWNDDMKKEFLDESTGVANIKPELKSTAFPDRPYSEALLKLCKDGTLDLQFVINCFVTGLPEETVKKICQDNAIDAHMLDLEAIKTESKTWDKICDDAEEASFGQEALKVKDQARYEMEELLRAEGIDIDNVESVEDEIEDYLKTHNIRFADNGCILNENKQLTENKKDDIYNELSRVLTDYEGNGDTDLKDDPKPLYDMLVKIQNNWEDVITADLDESKKVESKSNLDTDKLANAFLKALDKLAEVMGDDFDYFDMACELLDGFSNSEVLEFLDEYGSDQEDLAESKKLAEDDTDVFSDLLTQVENLNGMALDYKGICAMVISAMAGMAGLEDNPEAMAKVNLDTVREIADDVLNEDSVWEEMDNFIYSSIYERLGVDY